MMTPSEAEPQTREHAATRHIPVRLRLARAQCLIARPPAGRDVLKAAQNLTHLQGFPAFKTSRSVYPYVL